MKTFNPPVQWKEWEKLIKQKRCLSCGKKLTMVKDPMTGKLSKYLYMCKKCTPKFIICVG